MGSSDRRGRYLAVVQEVTGRDPADFSNHLRQIFSTLDVRDRSVIDIGGGDGVFSFYAAEEGAAEVLCLEPEGEGGGEKSSEHFQRMQARLPSGGRVRLDKRMIQELDTTVGSFDVLLMNNSINHLDEAACIALSEGKGPRRRYRDIFTGIARLAKPGATLVVCDCSRYNFFALLGIRNPFVPEIEWQKHQPPGLWARLLAETGFIRPSITWLTGPRQGSLGRLLTGNAAGAFFFTSYFCLCMKKGGEGGG